MKGISERLQRAFRKQDISLYHKAGYTIRNAVVSPKDPLDKEEECGVVYQRECEEKDCGAKYIGESGRSLGERLGEHDKSLKDRDSKSALSQHQEQTGHVVVKGPVIDNITILDREPKWRHRKVLEAIHIRLGEASLNRNKGADLPDLYLPLLREEREGGPAADLRDSLMVEAGVQLHCILVSFRDQVGQSVNEILEVILNIVSCC